MFCCDFLKTWHFCINEVIRGIHFFVFDLVFVHLIFIISCNALKTVVTVFHRLHVSQIMTSQIEVLFSFHYIYIYIVLVNCMTGIWWPMSVDVPTVWIDGLYTSNITYFHPFNNCCGGRLILLNIKCIGMVTNESLIIDLKVTFEVWIWRCQYGPSECMYAIFRTA